MKIRQDIDEEFFEKGFTADTDPFGRKDLADRLNKLYSNLQQGTVSILDGRWGTGKSFFVRQWKHHLESNGIPAIYFDAFAADYIESPFRAVATAFVRAAREARELDQDVYDRFLSSASRAFKSIAAPATKLAVKGVTLGLIGNNEAEEFKAIIENFTSDLGDVSEAAVKSMLEAQAADESNFKALQNSLAALPMLLSKKISNEAQSSSLDESHGNSLVVIIDELDRCRPDFALGILEVLKHFFRAQGVHFILVTNMEHLLLSVNGRYGVGEAAGEYIQKFYDFIIPFEERAHDGRNSHAAQHASRLLRTMLKSSQTQSEHDLIETTAEMVTSFNLTLRQAERLVTNIVLSQVAFTANNFRPNILVAFLATLKAIDPSLFAQIKIGNVNYEKLGNFVDMGEWKGDRSRDFILNIIQYYSLETIDPTDSRFRGFGQMGSRYNLTNRLDVLPYIARSIIDRFG